MNTLSQNKTLLLQRLQQGQIQEAQEILHALQSQPKQNSLEMAEVLFLQAKIQLYLGKYLRALDPLQASLVHNPSHLTAHCDLALCYYQLGLHSQLSETLITTQNLLTEQAALLDLQEAIDNAIFIAKLFEELGRPEEALVLLDHISTHSPSPKQLQSLNIQRLRLTLECGDMKQATILYHQVVGGTEHTLNFEIEREHSLLLADCQIFGARHAFDRFHYLMEQNIVTEDRHFLASEMAEQLVVAGNILELKDLSLNINSESEYEKNQARLIAAFLAKTPMPLSPVRMEKILSPVSFLRLMRQVLKLFPEALETQTLLSRYRFHCAQLPSKKMQEMFLKSFRQDAHETTAIVDYGSRSLQVSGKQIPVKASLFWQLMPLFKGKKKDIPLDEVIQHIYQEVPNMQHFDRLRIGVSRLNTSVKASTDIEAIFKVSKNSITLLLNVEDSAS